MANNTNYTLKIVRYTVYLDLTCRIEVVVETTFTDATLPVLTGTYSVNYADALSIAQADDREMWNALDLMAALTQVSGPLATRETTIDETVLGAIDLGGIQ